METLRAAILLLLFALSANGAELRVLSYNVAGVPIVHAKIGERMAAIGERLGKDQADVVALQEVWRESDARSLAEASPLPHRARAKQGWLVGDGLMILSRHRIVMTKSIRFAVRTRRPFGFDGEQLANKGALLARVATPLGELDVYDVHFVADYKQYDNSAVRAEQLAELIAFIRRESTGRPVVLAGDLNLTADTDAFARMSTSLNLADPCGPPKSSTCASSRGKRRIDFTLVPKGTSGARAEVMPDHRLSDASVPLSDHLAVAVLLPSLPAPLKPSAEPAALVAQ